MIWDIQKTAAVYSTVAYVNIMTAFTFTRKIFHKKDLKGSSSQHFVTRDHFFATELTPGALIHHTEAETLMTEGFWWDKTRCQS